VPQLAAGEHTVVIRSRSQTVQHQIQVGAGETVSLLVPLAAAPPPADSGSALAVHAPIELRIFEGDRLIGTSQMPRVPLPAGTHRLRLENDAVGFRQDRTVTVAGNTTNVEVEVPRQRVAINALPWAEVWVDGARMGETPIGTLALPLGPHDIVLRHPQLGEKTVRVLVKASEPGRISVDMRK
jgi:hypothetical protein